MSQASLSRKIRLLYQCVLYSLFTDRHADTHTDTKDTEGILSGILPSIKDRSNRCDELEDNKIENK